jgi:hypothetical protein
LIAFEHAHWLKLLVAERLLAEIELELELQPVAGHIDLSFAELGSQRLAKVAELVIEVSPSHVWSSLA